jgi:hypothetical protein
MSDRNSSHTRRIKMGIGRMVRVSLEARARNHHRHRSRFDPIYLDRLAHRLAVAARLPLSLAQRRVKQFAVSAGAATDPGGDARWWKR